LAVYESARKQAGRRNGITRRDTAAAGRVITSHNYVICLLLLLLLLLRRRRGGVKIAGVGRQRNVLIARSNATVDK